MLRLRTSVGIGQEEYERAFLLPFAPLVEVLQRHRDFGYVTRTDEGHWALTPKGYLISNTIISDLLVAQDASEPLKKL